MNTFEISKIIDFLQENDIEIKTPANYFKSFPDIDTEELLTKLKQKNIKKLNGEQLTKMAWGISRTNKEARKFCGKCSTGYLHVLNIESYKGNSSLNWVFLKHKYGMMIPCKCNDMFAFQNYIDRLHSTEPETYELAYLFLFDIAYFLNNAPVKLKTFDVNRYFGIDAGLPNIKKLKYFEGLQHFHSGNVQELEKKLVKLKKRNET